MSCYRDSQVGREDTFKKVTIQSNYIARNLWVSWRKITPNFEPIKTRSTIGGDENTIFKG